MSLYPPEVAGAIRVLYNHDLLAKISLQRMFEPVEGEPERAARVVKTMYRDAGRDLGRFIIEDREHLIDERREWWLERRIERIAMSMLIIRNKPDPLLAKRLWEESMRDSGF